MFFILNHRNSIIAADQEFLSTLDACDVATASTFINSGEIEIDDYARTLEFNSAKYSYTKNSIFTLFGKGHIYEISNVENNQNTNRGNIYGKFASANDTVIDQDIADFFHNGDSSYKKDTSVNSSDIQIKTEESTSVPSEISLDISSINAEKKVSVQESIPNTAPVTPIKEVVISDNLKSDTISTAIDNTKETLSQAKTKIANIAINDAPQESTITAGEIDFTKLANTVGVSTDEYKTFLYDFVDETKKLVPQIKTQDAASSSNALDTLKEATHLLHLPHLTSKIVEMEAYINPETRNKLADEFMQMATLVQISEYIRRDNHSNQARTTTDNITNNNFQRITGMEELQSTSTIQAVPFKYDISEAVTALMLPKSMIEEFVSDFINQSEQSLNTMEDAYKNQDLSTIKRSAHMLKGVAANLHINPIVRTLSTLQSNNSLHNVPEITKLFAGQINYLKNKAMST